MPTKRTLSDIKANLLMPATTSHFEVSIDVSAFQGSQFSTFMKENGLGDVISLGSLEQTKLTLSCSDASLPGSSLATHEINNDYMGVTERHVYRRIYDDRIDFSFYVDAVQYLPIKFFEAWIKFIVNETISADPNQGSSKEPNFFYRVRYPDDYNKANINITKFERDYGSSISYDFLRCYPISITSMPVSYDASSLLKCTVSFTYVRYIFNPGGSGAQAAGDATNSTSNNQALFGNNAQQQAFQNAQFGIDNSGLNPNLGGVNALSTGGISGQAANSSGNSILEGEEIIRAIDSNQSAVEAGLPYVGRNQGPLAPFNGI